VVNLAITKERVIEALKKVHDPEIPINVVDLGLIYGVDIEGDKIKIRMTMTTPGCPMSYFITELVREVVREEIPEAKDVEVELVWDPPWTPDRMSDEAKKLLGLA